MDVDHLLAGQRFDLELKKALAVIGPRWAELLAARQAIGERDYVREEISTALAHNVPVIPVLVERAALPRPTDLPEDIRALVLHQKHDLVYESFGRDTAALIADMKALLKTRAKEQPTRPSISNSKRTFALLIASAVVGISSWQYLTFQHTTPPRNPFEGLATPVDETVTRPSSPTPSAPKAFMASPPRTQGLPAIPEGFVLIHPGDVLPSESRSPPRTQAPPQTHSDEIGNNAALVKPEVPRPTAGLRPDHSVLPKRNIFDIIEEQGVCELLAKASVKQHWDTLQSDALRGAIFTLHLKFKPDGSLLERPTVSFEVKPSLAYRVTYTSIEEGVISAAIKGQPYDLARDGRVKPCLEMDVWFDLTKE